MAQAGQLECLAELRTTFKNAGTPDMPAYCTLAGDTASNLIGIPANLMALADNGGLTDTHLPAATSPAVNAGNPAGCTDEQGVILSVDQRSQTRPTGMRCDIGAVEVQP